MEHPNLYPVIPPAAEYQQDQGPPDDVQMAQQIRHVAQMAVRTPSGYLHVDMQLSSAKKQEMGMLQHGGGIDALTRRIGLSFLMCVH